MRYDTTLSKLQVERKESKVLVVSRKAGESIVIDGKITVKIVSAGSDKVTVGIDAPREVSILRAELFETIEENKASAAGTASAELSGKQAQNLASLLKGKQGSKLPGKPKLGTHKSISPKD